MNKGSCVQCSGNAASCDVSTCCEKRTLRNAWPTFCSGAALQKDAWGKYFILVYGQIPTTYPLHTGDAWMYYDDALSKAGVTSIPPESRCPSSAAEFQRYQNNNPYDPPRASWSWHPYDPMQGYPAASPNKYVEVMHKADPYGDEHYGMWFLFAPGSGIWFNVGKTISFPEHRDAWSHFGVHSGDWNEEMSKAAAAKGYDSIQFTQHVDHVNYPCDSHMTGVPGLDYMGLEIVAAKLMGTYPCGTRFGAPGIIRAGWQASRTCKCSNSQAFLNCDGVPPNFNTITFV